MRHNGAITQSSDDKDPIWIWNWAKHNDPCYVLSDYPESVANPKPTDGANLLIIA